MHMQIGILTISHDRDVAVEVAKDIMENMTGEQFYPFDGSEYIGTIPVKSEGGRVEIKRFIELRTKETHPMLNQLRMSLANMSNEELITGNIDRRVKLPHAAPYPHINDPEMTMAYMKWIGQNHGGYVYMYDQDGEGIKTHRHLGNVLSKWKCLERYRNKYEGDTVYISVFDVHY